MKGGDRRTMSRHTGAQSFMIVSSKRPFFGGVAALALVNARLGLWIVGWVHFRGRECDKVSVRKGRLDLLAWADCFKGRATPTHQVLVIYPFEHELYRNLSNKENVARDVTV